MQPWTKISWRHSLPFPGYLTQTDLTVRADDMNLWLKDSAKKLGMRWTCKQEAEKDACDTSKQQLCTCDCSLSSVSTTATISAQNPYMMTVTDISFRHAFWLSSLISSKFCFSCCGQFNLRTIQGVSWAYVGCMLSIHPAKQTPRLEPSLLPHQHVLEFGHSFELSFANGVKWKQLKPSQSQRLRYSNFLWLNRKWVN